MSAGDAALTELEPGRLLYRPEEAAQAFGISRAALYRLLSSGALRSIKVGQTRRITQEQMRQFIADRVAESQAAA